MPLDWYPSSMDSRAVWHANCAANIDTIKLKYGLAAAMVTQLQSDNNWFQYWVGQRHAFDAASQQLTKYFNGIAGKNESLEQPADFIGTFGSGGPVPTPTPGIEARSRDVASQMKGHAGYSDADGELMMVVTPVPTGGGPSAPETTKPVIKVETRVAFEVGVKFKKFGNDGVRLEYRHQGGDWLPAGTLITSPGHITVAPATPGIAEKIEVRAIFLKANTPVGDYSDAISVFIQP